MNSISSYNTAGTPATTQSNAKPVEPPGHAKRNQAAPEATVPTDTVELSADTDTKAAKETATVGNGFSDFDMDAFQAEMRSKLLEMVHEAKKAAKESGVDFDAKYSSDDVLYAVADDVEAAEVPEYWNAENTSQRIVDYSMSFASLAPELSSEEYITQIRDAVIAGFKEAKGILGDLPGSVGKLFNDTYNLTMKKFDDLLANARSGSATTDTP